MKFLQQENIRQLYQSPLEKQLNLNYVGTPTELYEHVITCIHIAAYEAPRFKESKHDIKQRKL